MKRLLIISPYFPPCNTPDMQRVRMSLPYFAQFGWEAEVLTVDDKYADAPKDELLNETIPPGIKIHKVKALDKRWTSKIGFGNTAYRSYLFYRRMGNQLLADKKFDLVYFSTTQFSICTLGAYWKKKFGVPYVIDMQDPWHSDYYLDKPKHQRPPKYWLSYRLNKTLEPIALKTVDGLISVSEKYITDLKNRYPGIKDVPSSVITFGSFEADMRIAGDHSKDFVNLLSPGYKNVVYIGRGGKDMYSALRPVFEAIKKGCADQPETYSKLRLHFIGTSYAPPGQGTPTIMPLAKEYGLEDIVHERTDRISFYHALNTLMQADALLITGSDDPKYTASKIYPYLLTQKPVLAIFNSQSPAIATLQEFKAPFVYSYNATSSLEGHITSFFGHVLGEVSSIQNYNPQALKTYSAQELTHRECELFDRVMESSHQ